MLFYLVYSFYYSRAHPVLHSFPTPRSSDLHRVAHVAKLPKAAEQSFVVARMQPDARLVEDVEHADQAAAEHRVRSEEHTSELQSRPHLVCRLLLEKKKNPNVHIKANTHISV